MSESFYFHVTEGEEYGAIGESVYDLIVEPSDATDGALFISVGDNNFWLTYEDTTRLLDCIDAFKEERVEYAPTSNPSDLEDRVAALERSLADIRENGLRL